MTQPELAQKAGIEQSYLSKLENDKAVSSFNIINRISMVLGITGMELINSLSQSYVEGTLLHLPEIAAEYAVLKEKDVRISRMKERFNVVYKSLDINKGNFFIEIVDGGKGRRYYAIKEKIQFVNVQINLSILIAGVMLLVSGFMTFSFNKRFKL